MLGRGLAARLDLDDVAIIGKVVVGDVDDGPKPTLPLPRPQLDLREVFESEVADD